jgi:T-complex protein 1 subunit alpha
MRNSIAFAIVSAYLCLLSNVQTRATGGQVIVTMVDMDGNEAFDPSTLGECAEVSEERVGDSELLYFRGCKNGSACTVVLRGANEYMLDEVTMARFHVSIHH